MPAWQQARTMSITPAQKTASNAMGQMLHHLVPSRMHVAFALDVRIHLPLPPNLNIGFGPGSSTQLGGATFCREPLVGPRPPRQAPNIKIGGGGGGRTIRYRCQCAAKVVQDVVDVRHCARWPGTPSNAMQCQAVLSKARQWHAMLCNAMRYYTMLCDAMLRDAIRCNAMLYDAMRCDAVLLRAPQHTSCWPVG